MGRWKQFEIEFQEQELAEYKELEELKLNEKIAELKLEFQDKQDEVQCCVNNIADAENQEDIESIKEEIEGYLEEIKDLFRDLDNYKEQLDRYNELHEKYTGENAGHPEE